MGDPLSLMIIGALALVATVFWLVVAGVTWIVRRRLPGAPLGFAGASFAVVMLTAVAMPPGYDEGEAQRVQRLHAEFAPVLEAYRDEHGTYPPTLEAAGIATPQTRYGPLRYQARTDENGRPSYSVSFGDYFGNGFTSYWNNRSGPGAWHLDT